MTAPDEARAAMETAFRTGWNNRTPIVWENDLNDGPNPPATHVKVYVRHRSAMDCNVDGGNQINGTVFVLINTLVGTGIRDGYASAKVAQQILGSKKIGPVQMYAAALRELGPDQRGYYQFQVGVPFEYWA